MKNPNFKYYKIQNKSKIPNPKILDFENWDLFGSIWILKLGFQKLWIRK